MSRRCNPGKVFIPFGTSEELCSRVKGSPDGGLGDRRGLCTPRTHWGYPRAHLQLGEQFCQCPPQSSVLRVHHHHHPSSVLSVHQPSYLQMKQNEIPAKCFKPPQKSTETGLMLLKKSRGAAFLFPQDTGLPQQSMAGPSPQHRPCMVSGGVSKLF